MKQMNSKDIVDLYTHLENLGIQIWIDGGWSVDALLGKQTRSHKDLDITIQRKDLLKFREYLESQGYREVERDEDKKWDLVLRDASGREIDVHAFTFDNNGHKHISNFPLALTRRGARGEVIFSLLYNPLVRFSNTLLIFHE